MCLLRTFKIEHVIAIFNLKKFYYTGIIILAQESTVKTHSVDLYFT